MAEAKAKGIVDLVFLLDVTGSMQPCIDALKANISLFIDALTLGDANHARPIRDWRAKVVGYRDFEDAERAPFEDNPFVRDPAALKAQLEALVAVGGGDEPESLLDALYLVATQEVSGDGPGVEEPGRWRHRHQATRMVVVFTDATFRPRMAIPQAKGGGFEDVANVIGQNKLFTSFFAPDFPCYQETFQALGRSEFAAIDYSGTTPQQALADFTADAGNFKATLKELAASISTSAAVDIC